MLRRSRLHRTPLGDSLAYERLVLPSVLPAKAEVRTLVQGALALAGRPAPADAHVVAMYQEDAGAGEQRRAWHIDFRHAGVPLSTGRCTLSAAAGRASPAMLACEGLPSGNALRFEPFTVSEGAAVQQAIAALGLQPGRVDTSRVYKVEDGVARARYQVIVFDGQQEDLALVSGPGEVTAVGYQTPPHIFDGTSDGFLFAHEYHHHIQEHLARLNHWALYPNQSVLFPAGGVQCDSATGCRRRQILTEGLADAFGAVATGRPFGGTLSLDTDSFPLDPCFPEDGYGGGALPGGLLGGNGTHVLCTHIAFGNWALNLNDQSGCGPESGAISSAHDPRRAFVLSGALWQYFTWFRDAGMSKIVPARHMIRAEAALTETTSGEVDYLNALVDYLMSLDALANRRYVHLARAAFAEKGVFLKTLHEYKNGSGYEDAPLRLRCDAGSCSNSDSRQLLGGALTAAGSINWKQGDTSGPEFRGFVVPGTRFENKGFYTAVGHLDLSTDPSFSAGSTVSQEIDVGTDSQHDLINCSPPGFFYATVPAATYNALSDAAVAAASASGAEPRVYYRLRECFTDGACVNTTRVVPAYTVILPTGSTGCTVTCAVGAPRSGRTGRVPGLLAAVLGLGLFGVRRRSLGRRRQRQERQPCAAS